MSPASSPESPQGGKRLNRVALYIGLTAVTLFCIIMALVASDRAKRQAAERAAAATKAGGDTEQFAKAVAANGDGWRKESPAVAPTPLPTPTPTKLEHDHGQLSSESPGKGDPYLEQLRAKKLALFENAVAAKTLVRTTATPPPKTQPASSQDGTAPLLSSRPLGLQPGPGGVSATSIADLQNNALGLIEAQRHPREDNMTRNDINRFNVASGTDRWKPDFYLQAPRSRYELRAGFVIPGVMISGINSDLPGEVIGQVAQDVYDTPLGRYLLIPKGTRIVGQYSSNVEFGQTRVLIAWQRLVMPDGKALDLGAMPGADGAGFSGFHDLTYTHFTQTFGSALLISAIVGGVSYAQNISAPTGPAGQQNLSSSLASSFGTTLGQTMTAMLQKFLNVAPTQVIRPGYRFNIMVNKDLDFVKPYRPFDYSVPLYVERGFVSPAAPISWR
jgi:type IV secretory pathway VirB10-like protein